MNIALIGYGRMGHAIERLAIARGHQIVLKITHENLDDFTAANLRNADVAIEFTAPAAAPGNVALCLNTGVPVVCGTTGWNEQMEAARALSEKSGTAFLPASNFSVGVNIFFEINMRLAKLMGPHPSYRASIEEIHHTQKKDAPSGTAITLAEQILAENPSVESWNLAESAGANDLPISAVREDGVPGTHTVSWASEIDTIDIVHTAHSRDGFALGAVLAAEFIRGKSGCFQMKDVLGM